MPDSQCALVACMITNLMRSAPVARRRRSSHELHDRRGEDAGLDVVGLPLELAVLRAWNGRPTVARDVACTSPRLRAVHHEDRLPHGREAGPRNPEFRHHPRRRTGTVCATASSLRQTHHISRIITTIGAGAPTMSFMKYFTAPPRLPAASSLLEPPFVRRAAALARVVHVGRLVGDDPCRSASPLAAASSASAPPDDSPTRLADPPASWIERGEILHLARRRVGRRVAARPRPRRSSA